MGCCELCSLVAEGLAQVTLSVVRATPLDHQLQVLKCEQMGFPWGAPKEKGKAAV